jgi:2-oxoglutarate dehydrogenase E2 component (dihydrolipoamide succinyltransferase)
VRSLSGANAATATGAHTVVLVEVGEFVHADEVVVSIETEKVTVDVNAPKSGKLLDQFVAVGGTAETGKPLFKLDLAATGGSAPAAGAPPPPPPAPAASSAAVSTSSGLPPPPPPPMPARTAAASAAPPAPPAASKPAAAPAKPAAPGTAIPPIKPGSRGETRVAMSTIRMRIAERLKHSQNTNAMLTTFNEIDMTCAIA